MQEDLITTLKENYNRDLRKQVVKSVLQSEKDNDEESTESSYKIINQIFTYIISELKWSISQNTNDWDDTPLQIMREVFPKIETTKWFQEQQINITPKS